MNANTNSTLNPDPIPISTANHNNCLDYENSEKLENNKMPWHTVRQLILVILRYPYRVTFALLCLVLSKVASVSVPLVLGKIVDDLNLSLLSVPIILALAYGLFRFLSVMFAEIREIIFASVTKKTVCETSYDIFKHLLNLDLKYHLDRHTGLLSRDLERGAQAVNRLIDMSLYLAIPTLIEMLFVMAVLSYKYHWSYVIIISVSLIIYFVITILITNWRVSLRRESNFYESQSQSSVVDALLNYETVKYFNNEKLELSNYQGSMEKWKTAAIRTEIGLSYLNSSQSFVTSLCAGIVLWIAIGQVTSGAITTGGLVTITTMLLQLFVPLNMLGVLYRELRHAVADIERMFRLYDIKNDITETSTPKKLSIINSDNINKVESNNKLDSRKIEFINVDFGYGANRQILNNFCLTLQPGSTTAVVGNSGGGKSTLVRLLFRFYDINKGKITIDDIDIRDLKLDDLRREIAIVPQDTVLFNSTIYSNIAYGRSDASREEVENAAKSAHLHDFINSLPQGYDTTVGERGLKLSGGEKQRVAIARALLKNPSIMIFDEATSALDSHAEKAVQAEIDRAAQGRTALIIAHRLSTIQHADNIAVLEKGVVVEQGHHQELLAKNSYYAKLWQAQEQVKNIS